MTSTPGRKKIMNKNSEVRKCSLPGTESHSVCPEQRWDTMQQAGRGRSMGRMLEGAAEKTGGRQVHGHLGGQMAIAGGG